MEKDKKYNVVLGLMIFFFILFVGVCTAWGLGYIGFKSNESNIDNNISDVQSVEKESEKQEVTDIEKVTIEEYIEKIYFYLVNTRIPNFDNINEADEEWIWDVAFKQRKGEKVSKNDLILKAKELFGDEFNKEPKPDDLKDAYWNEEGEYYTQRAHGMMVGVENCYIIKEISKKDNKYEVEVLEYSLYVEDYINDLSSPIKIMSGEKELKTIPYDDTDRTEIINYVKENASKFDSRVLELEEINGKIYITSCRNK